MTAERQLVVVSAGLSDPSSTRLLADRITTRVISGLAERGESAQVRAIELRELAHDITNAMLMGFPPAALADALAALRAADGVVAVTPIFSTSYSGLFKSFIDILDRDALEGTPVLLGATAGTARHSLAIDYAIRPLFTYLHAEPVPTGVFASSDDWGASADTVAPLQKRIDRAASELVAALAGRAEASIADPFDPDTYLAGGTSFEALLGR